MLSSYLCPGLSYSVELVDLERHRLALYDQWVERVGLDARADRGVGSGAEDDLIGGASLEPLSDIHRVADGRVVLQMLARADVADDRQASMDADAVMHRLVAGG